MSFRIPLLSLALLLTFARPASAEDASFPKSIDADETWVESVFQKGETEVTTRFKLLYPFPPEKVWKVLIDTNSWKDTHSEYTDSRTLDKNQADLVDAKKPTQVKAFYELVGEEKFPSEHGRVPGKAWTSYVFQRFNLPWPLADRWVVIRIKNDEDSAKAGKYRYEYRMMAGNFAGLKGYWALEPSKDYPGYTVFSGEYRSDPGISVPQFLAKKIFKASIKRAAKENIEILNKQAGASPKKS